ncbi:MAG: dienelactone hydrolase family protein [Acidobacteriia bacterium]|nr:dienelactone hydrolase family protein [Terriglobia bacterium]
MNPQTEYVTLPVGDGTSMRAFVARPAAKPAAGLLVLQEAFGVNAHIRDVAARFAREGYLAISPELFHRTGPGFEGSYTDFAAVMPHYQGLTSAGLEADIRAAFDWLQASSDSRSLPTGAVGYCMGGRAACHAALAVPLACAISYYGGGIAPNPMTPGLLDRLKDLKAPMLFFWGGRDQHIGAEQIQAVTGALRAAGKPYVNVEFSEADHGFFCDARASYHAAAAAESWALTLAYLKTHLAAATRKADA